MDVGDVLDYGLGELGHSGEHRHAAGVAEGRIENRRQAYVDQSACDWRANGRRASCCLMARRCTPKTGGEDWKAFCSFEDQIVNERI